LLNNIDAQIMYNPKIERCATVLQKKLIINNGDAQTTTGMYLGTRVPSSYTENSM